MRLTTNGNSAQMELALSELEGGKASFVWLITFFLPFYLRDTLQGKDVNEQVNLPHLRVSQTLALFPYQGSPAFLPPPLTARSRRVTFVLSTDPSLGLLRIGT